MAEKPDIVEVIRHDDNEKFLKEEVSTLRKELYELKTTLFEEVENLKKTDSLRYNRINYDVFNCISDINETLSKISTDDEDSDAELTSLNERLTQIIKKDSKFYDNIKEDNNDVIEIIRESSFYEDELEKTRKDFFELKISLNEEVEKLKNSDGLRYNKINYDVFNRIDVVNNSLARLKQSHEKITGYNEKVKRKLDGKIDKLNEEVSSSINEKIINLNDELSEELQTKYNTLTNVCNLMEISNNDKLTKLSDNINEKIKETNKEVEDVYLELSEEYESGLEELSEHLTTQIIETNKDIEKTSDVITTYVDKLNENISKSNELYETKTTDISNLLQETANSLNSFKDEHDGFAKSTLKYIQSVEETHKDYKEEVANKLSEKLNSDEFNTYVVELKENFEKQNLQVEDVKSNILSITNNVFDKISLTNEQALNSEQINILVLQLLEEKFKVKFSDALSEQEKLNKKSVVNLTDDIKTTNEKVEKFLNETIIKTEYKISKKIEEITESLTKLDKDSLTLDDVKKFIEDSDIFKQETQNAITDYKYQDGWLFFKKGDGEWETPIRIKTNDIQQLPIMGSSGLGGGAVGGSLEKYYLTKLFDVNGDYHNTDGKLLTYDEVTGRFVFTYGVNDEGTSNTDIWTAEKIMEYVYSEGNEILEVDTYDDLPEVGELEKYYVTLDDENVYRWSGSLYINMNDPDLMLLTGTNSNIDYLDFNLNPTIPTHEIGRLHWNSTDKTLEFKLNDDVTLQIGQEEVIYVFNNTSEDILNGTLVGADVKSSVDPLGNKCIKPVVVSSSGGASVLGITTQLIVAGGYGFVTVRGKLRDYNTSMWSHNDKLFADPLVDGGLTNIKPDSPNHIIRVGWVNKSAEDGIIYVEIRILDKSVMFASAGVYQLPEYTDNEDGTLTIEDGVYVFAIDDEGAGPLKDYRISGGKTGTDFDAMGIGTNYIYAEYNDGSPQILVSQDASSINQLDVIPIYTVYKDEFDVLRIIDWDYGAKLIGNKLSDMHVRTERFRPEINALMLDESVGRYVTLTGGYIWAGHSRIELQEVDSSDVSHYLWQWVNIGGTWSKSAITTYNNTQYTDSTEPTGFKDLIANRYTVHWVFRSVASNRSELGIFTGGTNLNGGYTLAEAQESNMPELAPFVSSNAIFVGRIIVKIDGTEAEQIDSAFDTTYNYTRTSNHNNLAGLQGGDESTTPSEYYHLTEAEHTKIQTVTDSYEFAYLDGDGKIPSSQLTIEAMEYKGIWDASTNTPTLIDGTGNTGDVYKVSVDGTQDLGSGSIDFKIGDWAIYNGTIWENSQNQDLSGFVPYENAVRDLDMNGNDVIANKFYIEQYQDISGTSLSQTHPNFYQFAISETPYYDKQIFGEFELRWGDDEDLASYTSGYCRFSVSVSGTGEYVFRVLENSSDSTQTLNTFRIGINKNELDAVNEKVRLAFSINVGMTKPVITMLSGQGFTLTNSYTVISEDITNYDYYSHYIQYSNWMIGVDDNKHLSYNGVIELYNDYWAGISFIDSQNWNSYATLFSANAYNSGLELFTDEGYSYLYLGTTTSVD